MDLHRDCAAETPAAEPPAGKINKTAFKLFKKRKSGGTMPSIFGVRSKGDGKGAAGKAGMVRSRTHDGLAEVAVLEGGRKEDPPHPEPPRAPVTTVGPLAPSSVAKSHSFFSLLKKNGRGEPAEPHKAGCKQKRGLKGIFHSMRWYRKERRAKEEDKEEPPSGQAGLIRPGSLTASLECVQAGAPRAAGEPAAASPEARDALPGEARAGEPVPAVAEQAAERSPGLYNDRSARPEPPARPRREEKARAPPEVPAAQDDAARTGDVSLVESAGGSGPDPASSIDPPSEPSIDRICLLFSDVTSLKSFDSVTGCGDIIADPEEAAGPSGDKNAPGPGKTALSTKNASMLAYQGGGEEMASPDEVDNTYLQEFWDMLSQTEDQVQGPQDVVAKAAALDTKVQLSETAKETRRVEAAKGVSLVKRRRLHRIPVESQQKEDPKHPEKEQHEGVPNSDEGYWDSTTPGPEEDGGGGSGKKTGLSRDSYSGDAVYDLYADPDDSPTVPPANEDMSCLSRLKPVSPVTITCPLRTPGSLLKDSKIPISVKHFANLPTSHSVAHQQPTRSEMPRTKIPVSKVLVRRVSNRGLAGTTLRAASCHDGAKKL
ncbi:PREDICTED: APC membrane recruitment protein 2 isoform X1 [Chrysochloris asiatica]|uniref:APC membrane recruitment protein 2 n=1 Tax=Chrysochloris asiatica TaxID=185453 RepID=A0A9B0SVU1_CHRAS|nr:PREDICTED: APC membrane recruitment protein 2 isoform X1 [Chrysochloris asiatica]